MFDTIVHAHALLHVQHTTMLQNTTVSGQTNFCRVAVHNTTGTPADVDACKADIANYSVSFDAGILNNPSKKLLKPSNTVGEAAWNEIVAKDDSTETFGQCIAGVDDVNGHLSSSVSWADSEHCGWGSIHVATSST
jgi:hypothetical protein